MEDEATASTGASGKIALALLSLSLAALLAFSLTSTALTQRLFVSTTYYFMLGAVLCWAGTYLHAARDLGFARAAQWAKDHYPGIVTAFAVAAVAALAVEPALRVLSDEANLVGVSKNLFTSKTATFTVSGKNYYGSYWDVDVAIDRRPTLFPFLVSLLHAALGYSHQNAFLLNLLLLAGLVFVAYRIAKSMGGETFGVISALFVAAHPITLLSARSAGFDLLAVFFGLLVLKSLLDFCREPSPARLAISWMNLCLFAEVRYETALFVPLVVLLLLLFRLISWRMLRPYALVYVLTPAYLMPRIWQAALRGNVPEQEPGTVTFSVDNFLDNVSEYFAPLLSPSDAVAHSLLLIAVGLVGAAGWLRWLLARVRARDFRSAETRFAIVVAAWMLLQAVIVFSYVWGRAQYPSSARLLIAIDTFFSFAAAWVLTRSLARFRPFVPVLLAVAVVVIHVPAAAQQRMMNRLTQTRENAATWRFFERLGEERILIVTDRPNHFTIMNYGAMDFESARRDPYLFTALARRLFQDVYVIQQIELSTGQPLPKYAIWPDRNLTTVFEFQNDANVLVRISRLPR
jgi:4-amino-4-deoxy-L-arabinose transferase-like glycosyltransferase